MRANDNKFYSAKSLAVTLIYKITHKTSNAEDSGVVQDTVQVHIEAGSPNTTDGKARAELLKMLQGEAAEPVLIQYILPKFLKVTNRGTVSPIEELMVPRPGKHCY